MNVKDIYEHGWQCPKCLASHMRYTGDPAPYFVYREFGGANPVSLIEMISVECARCGYEILVDPADRSTDER